MADNPALLRAARHYARKGLPVLPLHTVDGRGICTCGKVQCESPGKHPDPEFAPQGVHSASTEDTDVLRWWTRKPDRNVGVATGGDLFVLDVDPRSNGDWSLDRLEEEHAELETVTVETGSGGWHYWFRGEVPARNGVFEGIDVKAAGGYVVAPPSRHATGRKYRLREGSPKNPRPAPAWLVDLLAPRERQNGDGPPPTPGEGLPDDVEAMLAVLSAECGYEEWLKVGMALHHADPDAGFEVWDRWSSTSREKYPGADELRRKWDSFGREDGNVVTVGTLRHMAQERGYRPPPPPPSTNGADPAPGEREEGRRDLTHDGLALDLGDRWEGSAKYVEAWGRWMFWNGRTWETDERLLHMTRTRAFLRSIAEKLPKDQEAAKKRLRQSETVSRVVSLARSNVAQAATVGLWDADPFRLPGVDLGTGEARDPDPRDFITKDVAVRPAPPGVRAPRWEAFLDEVTGGKQELRDYLQRVAGYALTGSVQEHVMLFLYGTGANGKSVFVNTLTGIWADYAATIGTDMLMVSKTDRHPTEIARLRGIRLAVGGEVEVGRTWAEAKVKELTGGDPLHGRFMRRDFFEFDPQFKLVVVGNHKPSLRGVDEAIRRRLHLVPFTVTIPERDRDPKLREKLREEWPAILRWAIDGCLAWQRDGLRPPEAVKAATDAYLEAEDAVQLWVDECCSEDPNAFERSGDLYASWKQWSERVGEFTGSQKRFSQRLEERGVETTRGRDGSRGFQGLALRHRPSTPRETRGENDSTTPF